MGREAPFTCAAPEPLVLPDGPTFPKNRPTNVLAKASPDASVAVRVMGTHDQACRLPVAAIGEGENDRVASGPPCGVMI